MSKINPQNDILVCIALPKRNDVEANGLVYSIEDPLPMYKVISHGPKV